jgi:hypothetical protein
MRSYLLLLAFLALAFQFSSYTALPVRGSTPNYKAIASQSRSASPTKPPGSIQAPAKGASKPPTPQPPAGKGTPKPPTPNAPAGKGTPKSPTSKSAAKDTPKDWGKPTGGCSPKRQAGSKSAGRQHGVVCGPKDPKAFVVKHGAPTDVILRNTQAFENGARDFFGGIVGIKPAGGDDAASKAGNIFGQVFDAVGSVIPVLKPITTGVKIARVVDEVTGKVKEMDNAKGPVRRPAPFGSRKQPA